MVDLSGRYDSLIGYFAKDSSGQLVPTADLVVQVRPGLQFDLETPVTQLSVGGAAEYLWYTGLLAGSQTGLSRFQGQANLDASFNRNGSVEVRLGEAFTRSDRTQNIAVGVGVLSLYNNLSLAFPIHPGGKALEIIPRAAWGVEFFDPLLTGIVAGCSNTADITCNPTLVGRMNYSNLNFGLSGRWKFLPKTAFLLDTTFDWRTYFDTAAANPAAMVLRAQAGLVGLVSQHFSVTLLAGYGGNLAPGSSLNTFIANAEAAYLFAGDSKVSLGYVRSVQPVPSFGTYISDGGRLSARVGLWSGRLVLGGAASVESVQFSGTSARRDLVFAATVGPSLDVASWFQLGLAYNASTRSSSNALLASVNFLRHEALLRLTFRY
jgi:hypothetical protein